MKKLLHIQGMHCVSCEILLSKELKKLPGFHLKNIQYKKGILVADFVDENQLSQAIKIIEKHNFKVSENKSDFENNSIQGFLIKIIFLIVFGIIFYLLSIFVDINSFIPQNQNGSYFTTFLIGIVASLSTCLAITGGIVIGFSQAFSSKISGLKGSFIIQLLFQLGRLGGFFLLGGLLGILGNFFSISLQFSTILTIFISFVLIYIGLQILGFVPNISRFGFHLPKSLSEKIDTLKHPFMAPIVGALTFFIPCGFTQSVQLLAISSGNFWVGGLIMLFFALGTFPVLFLVGLGSTYFSGKKFPFIEMLLGIIILIFGIHTFTNAYNLIPSLFYGNNKQAELSINDEFEIKDIVHNGWNIEGYEINLEEGKNYKIIIVPQRNGYGCMQSLTIPKLSNKVHKVKKGMPIIYEIPNAQKGEYKIVCSTMGMTQGAIIVN